MATNTPSSARQIGSVVRAEMARAGLNQTQVAGLLGITQPAVSARLRGSVCFRVDELIALAREFGIPIAALIPEGAAA